MDGWFTQVPLLRQLTSRGFSLIGMVKEMKQRYLVQRQAKFTVGCVSTSPQVGFERYQRFLDDTQLMRFVLLSTDVTLDAVKIVPICGIRWSIETFFKVTKS
ncbi:transposase [Paenibacillus sp. PCH8]|uniref:transposase n=1 Tax=Paenibacillus sp. PCH8 TaxID=2066524 RepID=UPI0035BE433E